MKFDDFRYFVLLDNSNASWSFNGYTDRETGELQQIFMGRKDKNGEDVPHRFKFDRAHRSIRIHKDQKDMNGKNVSDFVANYPKCKDSKNAYLTNDGVQIDVKFAEIKEHETALTAIEAKAIQLEAGNTALNLEGDELREIAAIYGTFDEDEAKLKHRVLEEAGADPSKFLEIFNSVDRKAKALLIKAVKAGVVKVTGTIYTWEGSTLGVNKDAVISKLLSDEEVFEALSEGVKASGNA